MHEYASEGRNAAKVHFWLVLASVALALVSGALLSERLHAWIVYVIGPSAGTFYLLLLWTYDRWAWRWQAGPLRLSGIPDVHGSWGGVVQSSHREAEHCVSLQVIQTWSRIKVVSRTATSSSTSVAAALHPAEAPTPGLMYAYRNEPDTFRPDTQSPHNGLAYLKPEAGGRRLAGSYFTDRTPEQTKGELQLTRISRDLLDHDEVVAKMCDGTSLNGGRRA